MLVVMFLNRDWFMPDPEPAPQPKTDNTAKLDAVVAWLQMLEPDRYGELTAAAAAELVELRIDGSERNAAVNDRFVDDDLRHLRALPKLRKLEIWTYPLRDAGLQHVGQLQDLASLAIGGWSVQYTDEGLVALRPLRKLERLTLTQAQGITDGGMRVIAGLPALRFLGITYTKISNVGLDHLLESRSLTEVDYGWAAETRRWREEFVNDHPHQHLLK